MASYTASRHSVAGLVQSLVSLGSFTLLGIAAALTLSARLDLAPLKWFFPMLILLLEAWTVSHLHAIVYEASYAAHLENRINRTLGGSILDWESRWAGFHNVVLESNMRGGIKNPLNILFLILVVIWFLSVLGYALWLGNNALISLMGPSQEWTKILVTVVYCGIQGIAGVAIVYVWMIWVPRHLKEAEAEWTELLSTEEPESNPPLEDV